MSKTTDIRVVGARLYFIPIQMRIPLKFGTETVTAVTCARACARVSDAQGRSAEGWGETPLSVQWVWPSQASYQDRHEALKGFCLELTELWAAIRFPGHPIELGQNFQQTVLAGWLEGFNQRRRRGKPPM